MLCPPAVNDNGWAGCAPAVAMPVRAPDDLVAKVWTCLGLMESGLAGAPFELGGADEVQR
jgi:hypothetical protein